TASYLYIDGFASGGKVQDVQSPFLAAIIKNTVGRWTFSDRNRVVGLFGGGTNYWVYRNRPQIDYCLADDPLADSVFVSDEMFYFANGSGWARNRAEAGLHLSASDDFGVEVYYVRQDSAKSLPHAIDG